MVDLNDCFVKGHARCWIHYDKACSPWLLQHQASKQCWVLIHEIGEWFYMAGPCSDVSTCSLRITLIPWVLVLTDWAFKFMLLPLWPLFACCSACSSVLEQVLCCHHLCVNKHHCTLPHSDDLFRYTGSGLVSLRPNIWVSIVCARHCCFACVLDHWRLCEHQIESA